MGVADLVGVCLFDFPDRSQLGVLKKKSQKKLHTFPVKSSTILFGTGGVGVAENERTNAGVFGNGDLGLLVPESKRRAATLAPFVSRCGRSACVVVGVDASDPSPR